jgi:hypothetical protein
MASGLLDSSTFGGGSWLAHATLATGVRTKDGLVFGLLLQTQPPPRTLAWFFQQAGYRTVLVQPGTTRPWPEGEVFGFDRKYYEFDLDYKGPAFGWATMPDQYVIDFIHRRELAAARAPLFVEYALVSSHAPWTEQPALVEDWSRLSDSRVFSEVTPVRFDVTWSNIEEGGDAYLRSVSYDLQVLQRYLARLGDRHALIIVMGDHQPPGGLTGDDESRAVPVHVLSRDPALVDAFIAQGFTAGMIPSGAGDVAGMETFLPAFLEHMSAPRAP